MPSVLIDGTKIEADASRHRALSHGHIEKLEGQFKAEIQELLALAEQADQADLPDGVSLPEELKRREDRLAAMAVAKARIAARAEERYQREKAEYDEKMAVVPPGKRRLARSLSMAVETRVNLAQRSGRHRRGRSFCRPSDR